MERLHILWIQCTRLRVLQKVSTRFFQREGLMGNDIKTCLMIKVPESTEIHEVATNKC